MFSELMTDEITNKYLDKSFPVFFKRLCYDIALYLKAYIQILIIIYTFHDVM